METMANTAYKTLSGFSLPNPPAPSCMRRKAICIPFDISPKGLAKLFGSCLPTCRQFMSRLRGAITRMWIICVEKSEWAWRARGDAEQPARTVQGGAWWGCKWAWQANLGESPPRSTLENTKIRVGSSLRYKKCNTSEGTKSHKSGFWNG